MGPISSYANVGAATQWQTATATDLLAVFKSCAERAEKAESLPEHETPENILRHAGLEFLKQEGTGAIKLHALTYKDLLLVAQHYPPFPENDEVLSAIDRQLDSVQFNEYLSTLSAAEIMEIGKRFSERNDALGKKIVNALGKELQEKSNGSCKLTELDLPTAVEAVTCFASTPLQNRELLTHFVKKFVKTDEQGNYDFSSWELSHLLGLVSVVVQYKEGNEPLFDALFNECLIAERMNELWLDATSSDDLIRLLEWFAVKKEQALPLFRFFRDRFHGDIDDENEEVDADFRYTWTPSHYCKLIPLFGELVGGAGLEFTQLLKRCQSLLIKYELDLNTDTGKTKAVDIFEDIASLCTACYTLAKHGLLQNTLSTTVYGLGTRPDSPLNFAHIPAETVARFAIANRIITPRDCHTPSYDSFEKIIAYITSIIFIGNKDIVEKEKLIPFDLFLEMFSNELNNEGISSRPNIAQQFEQLFFIYQKAKEEGRITISCTHYAQLFQFAIKLQQQFSINKNKKLFATLATELQRLSYNFSTIFSNHYLETLSFITPLYEDETFEPISLALEKRILQRKKDFLKLPINSAAPFIASFGKRNRTNKDLFDLFEKYILDGGQAAIDMILPPYFSEMIHSFLKTGFGSRKLYTFFNEVLTRTNREGGTRTCLADLSFPRICKLLAAMEEKQRGTKEFYVATHKELLVRENSLKLEDLTHLDAYLLSTQDRSVYTHKCIQRLATRDHCAWLKTLSPETMMKSVYFVLQGIPAFRKPIQEFLLEKVGEKTRLQRLSLEDFASLTVYFYKNASDTTILEAIEREILANTENVRGAKGAPLFHLYIFFKKAKLGSQPFISLLEEELVKTRADGRKVLQEGTAAQLAVSLKEVNQGANPLLYEELKKELYTRGLDGFTNLCKYTLPTQALEMVHLGLDVRQVHSSLGGTALQYAAGYGFTDIVGEILLKGALLNKECNNGHTALYAACWYGQKESAQKLLERGADIGLSPKRKVPSFQHALQSIVWKNNPKKMKEFILHFFGGFEAVRERIESHGNVEFIAHFIKNPHLLIEKALATETSPRNPLEVAFLFHSPCLAYALFKRLLPSEALLFLDDLLRKYPLHGAKLIFQALFLYYCDNGMTKEALQLIEKPGCDPHAAVDSNATTFLQMAARGNLAVTQKLIEKKVDLNRVDQKGFTALHVACGQQHLAIAQILLQAGCNPIPLDSAGKTPFALLKNETLLATFKDPLERAFLLQDFALSQETIAAMPAKDFKAALQALKTKYPQSSMEFIEYSSFKINPDHFQKHVKNIPSVKPEGIKLTELLPLFDAINFTKPEAPHYMNPALFEFETGTKLVRDLRELFKEEFIDKIVNRVAYNGTPKAGTDALQAFYDPIEREVMHTIVKLKSSQDPALKAKTIIEYLRAAKFCGGRIARVTFERYDAVVNGKEATFEKAVYEHLGEYRNLLLDSLVPQGNQNVHAANEYFYLLANDLNLPNKTSAFKDHYAPKVEKEAIRKQFDALYRPLAIISDCLSMHLQDDNDFREKCLDWFKKSVPAEFDKQRLDPIKKQVHALEDAKADRSDIVKYLAAQGIAVQAMSYEEAILADQQHVYLEQEVVVDMTARPMQIKKSALAYALEKLHILRPC